jgi:hypothetical protein
MQGISDPLLDAHAKGLKKHLTNPGLGVVRQHYSSVLLFIQYLITYNLPLSDGHVSSFRLTCLEVA